MDDDENIENLDIQFVNKSPVGLKNLKFFNEAQVFVEYKTTIDNGKESQFETVPAIDAEYISNTSTDITYSIFNYSLAVTIDDPRLGPLEENKVYSIKLDSSFCFTLWERTNADVIFDNDTDKIQVGNKSCIDENDLPNLPF